MTDGTDAPLGHFDAGEPIWVVQDKAGKGLSYHRTPEGAQNSLQFTAGADHIQEVTLNR